MGIARGAVALLLNEARQRPFVGKLATLGRQTVLVTPKDIKREFRRFGLEPPPVQPCDDVMLFTRMGFASVESFDYSDYEGATHKFDLNQDHLPEQYKGAFDVMLDSGTVEHVFNIANALVNAVSMVKVGGRAIFLSPASNCMDHGFHTLSPGLFFDFFTANGWRIDTLNVIRHSAEVRGRFRAYAYTPESGRFLTFGLTLSPYLVLAIATRLPSSTTDVVPQQNFWSCAWQGQDQRRPSWRQRVRKGLERIPGVMRLVFAVWHTLVGAYTRHQQRIRDF